MHLEHPWRTCNSLRHRCAPPGPSHAPASPRRTATPTASCQSLPSTPAGSRPFPELHLARLSLFHPLFVHFASCQCLPTSLDLPFFSGDDRWLSSVELFLDNSSPLRSPPDHFAGRPEAPLSSTCTPPPPAEQPPPALRRSLAGGVGGHCAHCIT